jgi:hypothetical protein
MIRSHFVLTHRRGTRLPGGTNAAERDSRLFVPRPI